MEIRKPVFIIGSGRSGTTILYSLLALHPEVCWFSNLTERYPRFPWLAVLHRILDAPLFGKIMKQRLIARAKPSLKPSEAGNIYHSYCGFENTRKMTEDDLTEETVETFKRIIEGHLVSSGKPRFLNKQTANTQRMRVVDRMFPDAYYVNIIRDGRAVAYSLFTVPWWNDLDIWWLKDKVGKWEEMGREPLELCALHWQREVEEILLNKHLFEDRYLEIRYEELVVDTPGVIRKIARFCELKEFPGFADFLPTNLTNMNYKWETQLDDSQKLVLDETIGDFLTQLGYT